MASVPGEVVQAVSKALNWKAILTTVILTVVVIVLISLIFKPKITITDENGKVTGVGKLQADRKFGKKA